MSDFQITRRLKVIPLDVLVTKRSVGRNCAVTVNYHDYSIGSALEITAQIKFWVEETVTIFVVENREE